MIVELKDVCEKEISNIRQKDLLDKKGDYPIYGASGLIGNVDFYRQETPYVAVVKDGAGIGRAMLLPAKSSVIGTMQYLIPKGNVLPEYLYYVVKNMHLEKYYSGATIPHIYFKYYKKEKFNLVDLDQQRKIISVFKKIEDAIRKQRDELTNLDTLIKARFVEMFGDLKFDTPVSKYIESLTAGKSLAGKEKCTNKVLNTGAVSYDKFKNDYKYLPSNYVPDENNKVRTGNVLISRMNTQELVGATAYVWEAPENTYLPDRLWRANLKENVNSIFLWQVLIHPLLKLQIQRVSSGTSGSMKNISKSNFLKLKVPDVNEESQNKFATFVQQVDKSKVVNASIMKYIISIRFYLYFKENKEGAR